MRRSILLSFAIVLVGCGAGAPARPHASVRHPPSAPSAGTPPSTSCIIPRGQGTMGDCNPQQLRPPRLGLLPASSFGGVQCVDISENNGTVSFAYLRSHGISCVIAKAEEVCRTDSQFAHNVAEAHRHAMPLGIYDYFRPGFSATSTARCLASLARYALAHGARLLPAVFDVESFTEGPVCGALHAAEDTLRALVRGLRQMIYGSVGTYPGCAANGTLSWPADWGVGVPAALPGYGRAYTIWQYFGPRFASTTLEGMDRDKGAANLLSLTYPPKPKPKPLTPKQKKAKLAVLEHLLGAYEKRTNPHGHNCSRRLFRHAFPSARYDHACAVWAAEARALR